MDIVNEFVTSLKDTGDYSSNTIQAYESDLRRFFAYLKSELGRMPVVADITSDSLMNFLNAENKNGFSASTLHRRKISLTQFAQFLSRHGGFSEKEIEKVSGWKQGLWEEIYQREVLVLTQEEVVRLIAVISKDQTIKSTRDLSIIQLILETGLSVSEAISINLSDLDLRSNYLKVEHGAATHRYSIKKTSKTLQVYLDEGRPEFTQSVNEEALFISQMGGRISRQGIWQLVKEWGERGGLSVSLSPRILRNTAVLHMVTAGFSIAEIQKRLGHSNRFSTRALVRKIKRNHEESGMEVLDD
ncbi:MAG: tyrosine-type recombinase/integrase [Anaerolineales bacterium]